MLAPILKYRYFKYELLAKGAISKEDLPVFLTTWLDRSNSACMFSAHNARGQLLTLPEVPGILIALQALLLLLRLSSESQGRI